MQQIAALRSKLQQICCASAGFQVLIFAVCLQLHHRGSVQTTEAIIIGAQQKNRHHIQFTFGCIIKLQSRPTAPGSWLVIS